MGRSNILSSKVICILVLSLLLAACAPARVPIQPSPSIPVPTTAIPLSETPRTELPAVTESPTRTRTPMATRLPGEESSPTVTVEVGIPASPLPEGSTTPVVLPTASPQPPTSTPNPMPTAPLTAFGPWLAYYDPEANALAASNPDGSGRMIVLQPSGTILAMAGSTLSYLAVIVRWPAFADSYPSDEALIIYELPSGQVRSQIPLAAHFSLTARIDFSGSLAWSPDGRYLAYVAALYDESPDLYVYEAASRLSTRLTAQPNSAALPFWSPDGKWIIHTEKTSETGPCPGIALWAAAVDGSSLKELVRENCPTTLVGWYAPDRFVVSDYQSNLIRDIWVLNLTSGEAVNLLPADFQTTSGAKPILNPNSGDVIFDGCWGTVLCGTFVASAASPTPSRLAASFAQAAWVSSLDQFVGSPGGDCYLEVFSPGFLPRCILEDLMPADIYIGFGLAPDGSRLFVPSVDGYYLSTAALRPAKISAGNAPLENCHLVSWGQDGRYFLLRCEVGLLIGQSGSAQAALVLGSSTLLPGSAVWRPDGSVVFFLAGERLFYVDPTRLELTLIGPASERTGMQWVGK